MGNSCSGGFKGVRKRKRTGATSPVESKWDELTVACSEILPMEVWECILQNLKESTKDMLKCRLVCHDWKNLADSLLQRQPLWTPLFPYISSLPLIFIGGYGETVIRHTRGTRFPSARKLNSFLSQMKGYVGNPFPNRTVLLFPNPDLCIPSRRPHHVLYKRFPTLVSRFGEHIWALEYCVREDVPESVQLLRSLAHLPNLKSLTLYTRDWNKRSVRQGLIALSREGSLCPGDGDPLLGSLTQLQIMGSNGILPLNFLFGGLGEQLKSLYFCFVDDASSIYSSGGGGEGRASEIDASAKEEICYSLPQLTPNVTKLKVYEVNEDLVGKILPTPSPSGRNKLCHLQHLSVKLQRPFIRPLNRLVRAIDEHCTTSLESLHLEISRWPAQDSSSEDGEGESPPRDQVLKIETKHKLPSLKDLTISYSLFLQEPEFLFKFAEKCGELKALCFVSVNIHSGNFPDFEGFCKGLWARLPQSLERIAVRYWISSDISAGACFGKKQGRSGGRRRQRQKQPEPIPKLQTCFRPKPKK